MEFDGCEGIEIEVEPAAAAPRPAPAAAPIFKKSVWQDKRIPALRKHAAAVAAASTLTTAYFIPTRLLVQLEIRVALCAVLTARPKSKRYQGRETRLPWPLWHARGDWIAIPRRFGVEVFGRAATTIARDGDAVALTPRRPLFTAETCKQHNGIDQTTAVARVEEHLRTTATADGFAACIFCISPGYGKTCCAAHLIARLGRKALFVIPNENPFMRQVGDEMRSFLGDGVRVGKLVTSNKRRWDVEDKDIVITTAKSVATIPYDLTSFGTVVIDEGHETATAMYSQMYYRFNAKYVLVLTATPERAADHCGGYLQWLAGPVVWYEQRDIAQLRWGGVRVVIYNLRYGKWPIRETTLKSGEPYWEGMTRQIMAKLSRNRFLLEDILLARHRAGRRTLVLGTRIEHMEYIHAELARRHGIEAGIIVGTHSDGRKSSPEARLEAQRRPILIASIAIVSKALNIPELDTMVVLSGGCFVNDTFWQQAVGRITRDHSTKQHPELILLRDCIDSKLRPGTDGVFANCVDAACKTLRNRSKDGFDFEHIDVDLQ